MWIAFGSLTMCIGLAYGVQLALDPTTRTHKFFCTRCRRRAHYMQ